MKIVPIVFFVFGVLLLSCKQQNTVNEKPLGSLEKAENGQKYLYPTPEAWKNIEENFKGKGKFASVNFLKFKPMADYTGIEVSDKQIGKTGKEVYQHYIKLVEEIIEEYNYGRVIYFGESNSFFIGPENEQWDGFILVEYESVEDFVNFIGSDEYAKIAPHRTASLDDTRLLPSTRF
jgi:uncharacterized protein (DUF1330 family)